MESIFVTASDHEGMVCKAVKLPVSSDSDYRKVVSLLGAKHARIVGFIDDKHCIWSGNTDLGNRRPVFAIGSEQLSVNGPLLVTGYDQEEDRVMPVSITGSEIEAKGIEYSHMVA